MNATPETSQATQSILRLLDSLGAGDCWMPPALIEKPAQVHAWAMVQRVLAAAQEKYGQLPLVAFVSDDVFADLLGKSVEDLGHVAEERVGAQLTGAELEDQEALYDLIHSVFGVQLCAHIPGRIQCRGTHLLATIDLPARSCAILLPSQ